MIQLILSYCVKLDDIQKIRFEKEINGVALNAKLDLDEYLTKVGGSHVKYYYKFTARAIQRCRFIALENGR